MLYTKVALWGSVPQLWCMDYWYQSDGRTRQ